MSKKRLIVLGIVAIVFVAIFYKPIMQRFALAGANTPKDKIKVEFVGNSAQINGTFNLPNGCSEVGLYSKSDTFKGFLGENTKLQGNYTLTYLSKNGEVLKQKSEKLSEGAKPMGFVVVGSSAKHSTLMFDIAEVPYVIKQNNIIIDIKLDNLDPKILLSKNDIYLYVKKWKNLCGKEKTEMEDSKIESPENNQTLIPLYEAIKNHDINSVKQFFADTKLPYNVNMRGNRTPLHYAVYFNDANIIDYLVQNDKSLLDEVDITTRDALTYAIEYNKLNSIEELLKHVDINIVQNKEYDGRILQYFLIRSKRNRIGGNGDYYNAEGALEIFIKAGINTDTIVSERCYANTGNCIGETMLDMALGYQKSYEDPGGGVRKDYSKIIEILKKYNVKTYEELKESNTTQINLN